MFYFYSVNKQIEKLTPAVIIKNIYIICFLKRHKMEKQDKKHELNMSGINKILMFFHDLYLFYYTKVFVQKS